MVKKQQFKSVRSFIGAKNFNESRSFYKELGFSELVISETMSYFNIDDKLGFYLQKAFVKDWIDNSMIFLEVEDLETYFIDVKSKKLTDKFLNVKISNIVTNDWGKEFFLHDPSGILWHFGNFNRN